MSELFEVSRSKSDALDGSFHEDPLAAQSPQDEQQSWTNGRHATSTNISEVYRLVLDGCTKEEVEEAAHQSFSEQSYPKTAFSFGAVANLCSATLGAGVLSLPYALYEAGLIAGFILLVLSAIATQVSIHLLVVSCDYYEVYTYEELVLKIFGKKAKMLTEFCIILFCGGCAVAYIIAVGDILEKSQILLFDSRALSMVAIWLVAMLPLSLLRTMKTLQFASAVGIASIGTLIFAALIHLVDTKHASHGSGGGNSTLSFELGNGTNERIASFLWPANGLMSVLTACPIILFAFSCQVNVCAIYQELPQTDDTQRAMSRISFGAIMICTTLYSSIALIGLADFGASITPNILSSYEIVGVMQVASIAMGAAVIMAFPLNVFPARVTLSGLLLGSRETLESSGPNERLTAALLDDMQEDDATERYSNGIRAMNINRLESRTEAESLTLRHHVILTIILAGSALGLALVVPNISVVFGLLGGTSSSLLGFCIPGALGLRMSSDSHESDPKVASWMLLFGGAAVGLLTTGVTAYGTLF